MLVNATNVKNQKNVSIFNIVFKSNKLAKMNFVMRSELKRSTMNISKSSSKVILSRKKRDRFQKMKSSDEIKDTWIKNNTFITVHLLLQLRIQSSLNYLKEQISNWFIIFIS